MTTLLILGASNVAKKQLIPAALSSGCFSDIEIASRKEIDWEESKQCYRGYAKALELSKADWVYVSLVNSEHAKWVKQSLESGRHCIVDKPAFLDHAVTIELCALAEEKNLMLAESTVWTEHPQISHLISQFEATGTAPTKAVALFAIPPFAEDNFRWKKELGGGAIYDLGPYFSSTGRLLFGGAASSVKADILKWHDNVPLSFSVQALWPNGESLVGHFGFDSEYINRLEVLNEKMHITFNRVYTTPPDLENSLFVSEGNKQRVETAEAGNSFNNFFKSVFDDCHSQSFQKWREAMLDDSKTLNLLISATKEEAK